MAKKKQKKSPSKQSPAESLKTSSSTGGARTASDTQHPSQKKSSIHNTKSAIQFAQQDIGRSRHSIAKSLSKGASSREIKPTAFSFSVISFDASFDSSQRESGSLLEQKAGVQTVSVVAEDEKKSGAKKKKGKKGKEKKKKQAESGEETVEKTEETPPIQLDLQEAVEGEEGAPAPKAKKKKKAKKKDSTFDFGPKKKLSKKEKLRLAAEMAEKARIEAEEAAKQAAIEERIRLEQERKMNIEKEKRETHEQQVRIEQLEKSDQVCKLLHEQIADLNQFETDLEEWQLYVNCGRLPNPSKYDQMNTYLHLWEKVIEETTMEEAANRTRDVLTLLSDLDDLIDGASSHQSTEIIENWKWIRLLFRKNQAKSLDIATYRLLRNIEQNLDRIDIPTADYHYRDNNFALCLWLKIQLPTPLPNPRRPARTKIEIGFEEIKIDLQFPLAIDGEKIAIRALYMNYDHLSDLSPSYNAPQVPAEYKMNLLEFAKREWRAKLLYKYENRYIPPPPEPGPDEAPIEPEPEPEIGPDDPVPIVPYRRLEPTASEFVIGHEEQFYTSVRHHLQRFHIFNDDFVLNLRKFTVLGGVFSVHLIHQPPQPQEFVTLELNLTPLSLPKQLEFVDFYVDYRPPPPPEPGQRRQPEEIEEEMKKQEEEFDKLILITLTWPEHVIFLELPIVCFWDEVDKVWTKNDVHDVKHNEEKGQLSFRTGKCGVFALATYKYANLPYQAWEVRPDADGMINVQITAAILLIEFTVNRQGHIALTLLQNSPNNALQDIIGTFYKLPKLMRLMQTAGVDIFPSFDAFCYIDQGTCEKHWPMEKHLYYTMAQLSNSFNFAWSRWNLTVGRRCAVMQMREYAVEKSKQKPHQMVMVTPLKALYIECTEVSQTFSEEGIEGMKFYSDLFNLVKGTTSMLLQNKVQQNDGQCVYTLYKLLTAVRPLSFS